MLGAEEAELRHQLVVVGKRLVVHHAVFIDLHDRRADFHVRAFAVDGGVEIAIRDVAVAFG